MTLLSWDIPLISFNGSLWDVLLRCSKWLLWAWLDSFTMILRCWLVVWVKWARPLVSMTLWSRVMFNCKAVSMCRTAHFMGRPTTLKVNGATLGRSCPPGVQLLPHFEVWSYRACQPLQVWWFISFYEILALSYDPPKFAQCIVNGTFWAIISPLGRTSYPRSLIKVIAHHSRLGRTFWHLIHGSVTKTVGGVARRSLVRANSNNNTRMYISRRKCEWCLQWQNSALDRY